MSKSYGNHLWIFEEGKKLKKAIGRIATDSRPPEEPKDPASVALFDFLALFLDQTELDQWKGRVELGGEGRAGLRPPQGPSRGGHGRSLRRAQGAPPRPPG